ncbi:MAG: DHA2 family efflux MFS transporter permease subunit [Bacteroidetes bacterium]|nr:MAG: DHA2 family efflux MFS transporter permease subunit [Bacteroidota bacterium]
MNQQVRQRNRQVWIIISASLAGFMVLLDSNIINISLPVIAGYFNIPTGTVIQITLVYLLMLSSSLIIFGKLADLFGVKRIFVLGFTVFTVSSLLCGIAPTFSSLLLFRIFQAAGGSMLFATSISLITRFIPAARRGWAFGIFSPLTSLGMMIGNPLGGLITGMFNWHWIFLVNVPVGIAAIIMAVRAIPADRQPDEHRKISSHFDFLGSLLSFAGLGLLVFFISKGKELGWASPLTLAGLGGALLLLGVFILWERRVKDPILDLTIFGKRSFSFAILASVAGFGLMTGSAVLLPFYLTYGLHIDVTHAGFILMTFAVVFSLCSPITGRLSDRLSKVRLTITGMLLAAASCVAFALMLPRVHLGIVFAYMLLLGMSYALFITPNNNLVMSLVVEDKQSVSTSFFKLATNLGQMFGLILMELIFSLFIPRPQGASGFALKDAPVSDLLAGFSWAFVGGAGLCLLAVFFSLFIREKDIQITASEETAFLC